MSTTIRFMGIAALLAFGAALAGCGGKPEKTGTITGNKVNLRAGASMTAGVVGVVNATAKVVLLEKKIVQTGGKQGVLNKEVAVEVEQKAGEKKEVKLTRNQAVTILNSGDEMFEIQFAWGGKQHKAVVSMADVDTKDVQTWYRVRTKEKVEGWVFGQFLTEDLAK